MTLFVLLCVLLTALAVGWLVWPLLRAGAGGAATDRARVTLDVLKAQRQTLEDDYAQGRIGQAEYEQTLAELQARVIEEVPVDVGARAIRPGGRRAAYVIVCALPLLAGALYWGLGRPDALDPAVVQAQPVQRLLQLIDSGQAGEAIDQAQRQLKRDPDSKALWFVLARAYVSLGQYAQAAMSFEKLDTLEPNNSAVLADWADALARARNRDFKGQPRVLIERALQLEANNVKALAMAGAMDYADGQYAGAVRYWERLLALVAGTELAPQIERSIAQARQVGGLAASEASGAKARIAGQVWLDESLAASADANDVVFVVAQAVAGPRAPVAVLRMQVKDLPAPFTLDDRLAMAPELKLSSFDEVWVSARVAKAGTAMPQAGDLESQRQRVKVGARELELVIDRQRP
ncbi:MAG TPA: c-type cytochrome biogenesis protein CcmI [Burkholderiaceae bacterium]|nr:c-type cytochrome biogenesis protein CcmI [Burkholderiaceae bacterium]